MSYRILLLKDARPGHFRKSEGVAKALERRLDIAVDELNVTAPALLPHRLQRRLAASGAPLRPLLRLLWGIRDGNLRAPDLIISAGADTLVPNVLLARIFGCRNIFVGSVRGIAPERFSAILHVRPELSQVPRHIVLLSPSAVDPDLLGEPRPIDPNAGFGGRSAALLVGGPAPGFQFGETDWSAVASLVGKTVEDGLAWAIASSRRTPDAIADRLGALAASMPASVRFVDHRGRDPRSIDALFRADAILVTEDSNTMIAEAVASRRPVVVLRPGRAQREDASLLSLIDRKHVALAHMGEITRERLLQAVRATRPLERNPLDVLYERLAAAGIVPEAAPPKPGS